MTSPINPSASSVTAPVTAPSTKTKARESAQEIKKAAAAFEAILVRQMLTSANVAGKGNYADMGVEALSTAVTQGGGLGLGNAIERAIAPAHPTPPAAAQKSSKDH